MSDTVTFREAILTALKEAGEPLHHRDVTHRITTRRLV
ncbi:winged helix-turn-helix domain-containing protein [Corynebacterium terpenotabidum]|nr:winged helix-turn-helix domain-containing protein [Corynebacterium terpenotabidum]